MATVDFIYDFTISFIRSICKLVDGSKVDFR